MNIYYNNTRFYLPGNWNECTGKQLVQLTALLHKGLKDENVAALEALRIAWNKSRITFYGFMRLCKPQKWDDVKARALKQIAWVFDDSTLLTDQLLPKYKGLHGPSSMFGNLKMIEFHACEVYYHRLLHEKDTVWLNRLVAVLYRRKKGDYDWKQDTDGDVREAFNEYISTYYSDKIANWPLAVKQSVLLWYDGNRQTLIKNYEDIFGGTGGGEGLGEGMYGVMRSIAQSGIHGDFDKVSEMNIHKACWEMRNSLRELKNQQKQQP